MKLLGGAGVEQAGPWPLPLTGWASLVRAFPGAPGPGDALGEVWGGRKPWLSTSAFLQAILGGWGDSPSPELLLGHLEGLFTLSSVLPISGRPVPVGLVVSGVGLPT